MHLIFRRLHSLLSVVSSNLVPRVAGFHHAMLMYLLLFDLVCDGPSCGLAASLAFRFPPAFTLLSPLTEPSPGLPVVAMVEGVEHEPVVDSGKVAQ